MRFRRKSEEKVVEADVWAEDQSPSVGPYDFDELPADVAEVARVDFGSLLIIPPTGVDLRVQFDQKSANILSVLFAGQTGALEVRAFGAPRNADLWSATMESLKADVARRGGNAVEATGHFGPELLTQIPATLPNGDKAFNVNRFMGINGPRWLLRATLVGQPALEPDQSWYSLVESLVVKRGKQPVPRGEQLPITLPAELAAQLKQSVPGIESP